MVEDLSALKYLPVVSELFHNLDKVGVKAKSKCEKEYSERTERKRKRQGI